MRLSAYSVPQLKSTLSPCMRRRTAAVAAARAARGLPGKEATGSKREQDFQLEIDWIKALPSECAAEGERLNSLLSIMAWQRHLDSTRWPYPHTRLALLVPHHRLAPMVQPTM